MPLYRSPLRALSGFQGNQCASPRAFGAKGDGVTDDRAAIQSAINALKVLPGGGTLVIDGRFRVADTIEMDSKVSVEGVGSAVVSGSSSALILDHGSHPFFNWGTISSGFGYTRQRIRNVLLDAAQANSQTVFTHTNDHPLQIIAENITFNASPGFGLLNGHLWESAVTSSLAFRDCEFNQTPVAPQLFLSHNEDDALNFDNCRFRVGTNTNSRAIDMQAGNLDVFNCDFLIGITPQAGAAWVHTGPTGITRASHNKFHTPNNDVMPSFTWQSGARLVESNNTYNILTGPAIDLSFSLFTLSGTVPKLAEGSHISPRPNYHRGDGNGAVALTDYVAHESHEALTATTVTFTLPRIFMPGQRYCLTVKNSTGSALTTVFSPYNPLGGTLTNIANTKYAHYEFIAGDPVTLGTYAWYHLNTLYSP